MASALDVHKSRAFKASVLSGMIVSGHAERGIAFRYPKGHVPANKGMRRPGWGPGRMRETQFKKGEFPRNKDPDFLVLGALRVNVDNYIEMRTSFDAGAKGWTGLHRILWEDAHGEIPKGRVVVFRDGDSLNCCIENLELITRAELCKRNSIHNLPKPLKSAIQLLGQLKRRIREKQDRGSAQPFVRNVGGPSRQRKSDGSGSGQSGGDGGIGHSRIGKGGSGARASNRRARRIGVHAVVGA